MSPSPEAVREVWRATLAIGAVGVVSLAIVFRSARNGARMQGFIAAGLAALCIVVVAIFCFAGAISAATHADSNSIAYAAVWAFAGYALTLFTPLAPALLRYSRRWAAGRDARSPLPAEIALSYWLLEAAAIAIMSAIVLVILHGLGFGAGAAAAVLVPLCIALPPFMRAAVGGRFYGSRLLDAATRHPHTGPEDLASLRSWTNETAHALELGTFTVLVLPLARTFVVPLWGGAHLVVISAQMYALLDPAERRALVAHEIAHAESDDSSRRALLIMGVTLWLLMLIELWGSRTRSWPTGVMYVSIFVFITVLDNARRTLSHRAEFAADRRAVEIVGDRQAVIRTLMRIAQGRGRAAARDTRSHPSLEKRIEALQS